MSGDEIIVSLASFLIGTIGWIWWFNTARQISDFPARGRTDLVSLVGVIVLCACIVAVTLIFCAADDVRNAPPYWFMYLVMGVAWLRLASILFPFVGLNPRDDLLERRNPAAFPAWTGAMVGLTLCYAGGNVGNGPGWQVVVFSAALATLTLGVIWIAVGQVTGIVDAVTIDRDPAAGWRLGGFLAATGIVLGFAVTGDWVSVEATIGDFLLRIRPLLGLFAVAIVIERSVHPTAKRPRAGLASGGIVPALIFVGVAVVSVIAEWKRS